MNKSLLDQVNHVLRIILPVHSPISSSAAVVAVSGGPDSIALLHLLHRHASGSCSIIKQLHVVTIDHGLRSTSSKEAQIVQDFTHSLGIKHSTIKIPWGQNEFPSFNPTQQHQHTKIELLCRISRIKLFRNFLSQHHFKLLFTGHQRNDQIETILMKHHAIRWIGKLDGMSLLEQDEKDFWVARPLLEINKDQLIEYCQQHHLPYFNDPTNFDPNYTPRNRLRAQLQMFNNTTHSDLGLKVNEAVQKLDQHKPEPIPIELDTSKFVSLNDPLPTMVTLYPSRFNQHVNSQSMKRILKSIIEFVSPFNDSTVLKTLTVSNYWIQELSSMMMMMNFNSQELCLGKSFTPGGKVLVSSELRGCELVWIIGRQPRRVKRERQRDHDESRTMQVELRPNCPMVFDGRVRLELIRLKGHGNELSSDQVATYVVESSGRWTLPRVSKITRDGTLGPHEMMLDLNQEQAGMNQGQRQVSNEWEIRWRTRSRLR
ncbi:hypothetical protein OIO90_000380 [Microbotryomycetes sp. JL221]|nr:hypothetical protein OIO90_000380 [Microbotryomycetes sp. JL221]